MGANRQYYEDVLQMQELRSVICSIAGDMIHQHIAYHKTLHSLILTYGQPTVLA